MTLLARLSFRLKLPGTMIRSPSLSEYFATSNKKHILLILLERKAEGY
jgi:hypothetical protein